MNSDTRATNRKEQVEAIKDSYNGRIEEIRMRRDATNDPEVWETLNGQIDKLIDEREAEIEATRPHPADEAQEISAVELMDVIDNSLTEAWSEFNRIEDAINDLYGQVFYGGEVGEFMPYRKATEPTDDMPF
jgi:predicted sugar kinase